MNSLVYSTGIIEFRSNNKSTPDKNYSDRSLIELFEADGDRYFLQALDIPNQKEVIFKFDLTRPNLYEIGSSDNADRIQDNTGTYYVSLKKESRLAFHNKLRECYEKLSNPRILTTDSNSGRSTEKKPSSTVPNNRITINEKTILEDIHKLGECIQYGEVNKANELVRKLIQNGVQLRANSVRELKYEPKLKIRVKIDAIAAEIQDDNNLVEMEVYPSTKVFELRALFEYKRKFPPASQYYFVNGHLAHAESTMNDLQVQDGSLFVLFVI